MLDKNELTEAEKIELKMIALQKKKEQLEQEIEDIELQKRGFKNGKKSIEQMVQYFQD